MFAQATGTGQAAIRLAGLALVAGLGLAPGLARAADPWPDLKGTWRGQSEAVLLGQAPHYANSDDVVTQPRLGMLEVTLTITGQEGRRIWGTVSGGNYTEALLAVISADRKMVYLVDQDGYADIQLLGPDTMDNCYRHTTATSMLATCVELRRQK